MTEEIINADGSRNWEANILLDNIKRLEQENKELSFAIEKCLENAGIECDDEEQALRSLPMLGNAHYKALIEKEKLEQENKKLKYLISEEQCFEEGCNKCTKAYYTDDSYRSVLEKIREDMEKDTTCESRECGCDDYAECLNCIKETILNKINEVLQ